MEQTHSVSAKLGAEFGWEAAVLLCFLGYMIKNQGQERGIKGQYWYFHATTDIHDRYPYIPRTTIFDNLQRLQSKGILNIDRFNKIPRDRTEWYSFNDKDVYKEATKETGFLQFKVRDAVNLGSILAAIIVHHLRFKLAEAKKQCAEVGWIPFSGSAYAKHIGVNKQNVQAALKILVGRVVERSKGPDSKGVYSYKFLPAQCSEEPVGMMAEQEIAPGKDSNSTGKNSNEAGKNPNEPGKNPNNITVINELEESSKVSYKKETASPPPLVKTPEDSASANHADGLGDIPKSGRHICHFETYKELIESNNVTRSQMETNSDGALLAESIATSFAENVPHSVLTEANRVPTAEHAFTILKDLFGSVEDSRFITALSAGSVEIKHIVYGLALEYVIEALLDITGMHPSRCKSRPYRVSLKLMPWRAAQSQKALDALVKPILVERRKLFPNEKEHLMSRSDITPGHKRAVLEAYLRSRSFIGMRTREGKWAEKIIRWHRNSLAAAERFFERNPSIAVSHLAEVMERWIWIDNAHREGNSNVIFALPRPISLSNLLRHLSNIIEKTDVTWLPHINFLSGDELFGTDNPVDDEGDG